MLQSPQTLRYGAESEEDVKQISEELYKAIVDTLDFRATTYPVAAKKRYALAIRIESKELLKRLEEESK